jgi:hypothetical protein
MPTKALRKASYKSLHSHGDVLIFQMVLFGMAAFWFGFYLIDYLHRARLEQTGKHVAAVVTESGYDAIGRSKRVCGIKFKYRNGAHWYDSYSMGCDIVDRYPVNSSIPVIFDPDSPSFFYPLFEGRWANRDRSGLFLSAGFLALIGVMLFFTQGLKIVELFRRRLVKFLR